MHFSKDLAKKPTGLSGRVHDGQSSSGLVLLHSPPEPKIDFVFVHGLGGDARATWAEASQQSHFWPQEWLPRDPAFKNVRIHSYSCEPNSVNRKGNGLNIHHLGTSLLGALSTTPCLTNSRTPIVIIGHSMGGLVIKKAYTLAKRDPMYRGLAGRIAEIYFLATPHHGADSAKTWKNMDMVAYDRAYVAGLKRNSGAIQVINDEFWHVSAGLNLWSFYEMQHMRRFIPMIVDPEAAVLRSGVDRQVPMDADHRSICKFASPHDGNYVLLRNSLVFTVSRIKSRFPR